MNADRHDDTREVLAVFDDPTASALVLEWSGALAHATRRDLAVVYIESTIALRAAALPITQVLAHAGAAWVSFGPDDLERAYRVQAERLRGQAEQVARRHAVRCVVRTARGARVQAALTLAGNAALVLVGTAGPWRPEPTTPRVVLLFDAEAAGPLRALGRELATGIGGSLAEQRVEADRLAAVLGVVKADLVVLPRHLADPAALAAARQPVLIVGVGEFTADGPAAGA